MDFSVGVGKTSISVQDNDLSKMFFYFKKRSKGICFWITPCVLSNTKGFALSVFSHTHCNDFNNLDERETNGLKCVYFIKDLVGTAGMMSYDIDGTDYKVCIAYYTPFNDLLYDNQFNIKVICLFPHF